jgi:hypothetical protein
MIERRVRFTEPGTAIPRCRTSPPRAGRPARLEAVEAAEGADHLLDDLGSRQPGLAAKRVDPLVGAHHALVADLLATDAEDLDHAIAVHVVAHGDVVQHRAAPEPLLGGTADLAGRARDVVEGHIAGLDAERLEGDDDPLVEEGVRISEAHALNEVARGVDRVGDDGARLHEHRAAAGDAAHDVHAVLLRVVEVDLVLDRLEAPEYDGGLLPLPDAQGRLAAAGPDLLGENLVEGHLHDGVDGGALDELPLVVAPAGRLLEGSTHGGGHGLRGEPEEEGIGGERPPDGVGDGRGIRIRRQADEGCVDVVERAVGLEEEVACDSDVGKPSVDHLEVDDDELAARNFELAVH